MPDEQIIEAGDVAPLEELDSFEVTVHCPLCDVDTTIRIPNGHADEQVVWEHPCSNTSVYKGVWINPDATPTLLEVGPDDDVIWDGARREYVQRVTASESGSSSEAHA